MIWNLSFRPQILGEQNPQLASFLPSSTHTVSRSRTQCRGHRWSNGKHGAADSSHMHCLHWAQPLLVLSHKCTYSCSDFLQYQGYISSWMPRWFEQLRVVGHAERGSSLPVLKRQAAEPGRTVKAGSARPSLVIPGDYRASRQWFLQLQNWHNHACHIERFYKIVSVKNTVRSLANNVFSTCKGNSHYNAGLLFYFCYYWHCHHSSGGIYRGLQKSQCLLGQEDFQQEISPIGDTTFPWQRNHDSSPRVELGHYFEAGGPEWSCYLLEISIPLHAWWELLTSS